jgi:APA family basic amino acid/polyamine antiporter
MATGRSLMRRKPLDILLAELEGENRLRRVLGPFTLTGLGVGDIIGAGIFVSTGVVARQCTGCFACRSCRSSRF